MSSSSNQRKKTIGGSLPSSRTATTSTASSPVQRLKDVVAAVHEEDYATVVRLLGGEGAISNYPASIQNALQRLYVESLLQNGHAKAALVELSKWDNHEDDCLALRAYALYKQKEYKQVLSLIAKQTPSSSVENSKETWPSTLQYLRAQSLYHLSDLHGCGSVYQQLLFLEDDNADLETRVETYTNLVAARLATATPSCPTSCTENDDDNLVSQVLTLLEQFNDDSAGEYPYDLAYGLATWQLITNNSSSTQQKQWGSLLQKAIAACRRANKDHENAPPLTSELAPLLINQELLTGSTSAITSLLESSKDNDDECLRGLPAVVQWVLRANQSDAPGLAALKQWLSQEPPSSPTTTPLQKRLWYYNRAVLQLRCHKFEDCRTSCQFLSLHLLQQPGGGGGKKKSTTGDALSSLSTLAVHDVHEQIWWEARIAVLLAHCGRLQDNEEDNEQEHNVASAECALDGVMQKCQALPSSRLRDQTLTYLLTHKAAVAQKDTSMDHHDTKLLDTIVGSLSNASSANPAVLATKASLLLAGNQENQAVTLIQRLSNSNDPDALLPEFYLSQGHYAKAALLCETRVDRFSRRDDAMLLMAKAQWVRVLSFIDPLKAAEMWDEIAPSIPFDDDDDESHSFTGAELEAQELPRHQLGQQSSTPRVDSLLAAPSKKKKSRAAILRRRARQREQYLKDKELPHLQPDPERWIPKYERAARRRGRRQYHSIIGSRAAQGGSVSAQEALQLDVVARQTARAMGEIDTSRSTAHMTVSGSGGGRTGGKGSKRR